MKNKILFTIITIIALATLAPLADAVSIRFENTTDRTLVYRLYWLDTDWEWPGAPKIGRMVVGELGPGKNSLLTVNYKPGPYAITWEKLSSSDSHFYKEYEFTIKDSKHTMISTPDMITVGANNSRHN